MNSKQNGLSVGTRVYYTGNMGCLAEAGWRDTVARIAGKQGLASECLSIYDAEVAAGESEPRAALSALYEWDCCDVLDATGAR